MPKSDGIAQFSKEPTYEDYLDCLSLFELISESKSKIQNELNGVELESFK